MNTRKGGNALSNINDPFPLIILDALFVISIVGDFAFYDLWQQETDKASKLKRELNEASKSEH
jgi:hypothetical protein